MLETRQVSHDSIDRYSFANIIKAVLTIQYSGDGGFALNYSFWELLPIFSNSWAFQVKQKKFILSAKF